jgi:tetratricopeptide (TPR) repeat protein
LFAEAEENNLDEKVLNERFARWRACSLCEQKYHGVVACALGWACWKTYLGRPEVDGVRRMAMTELGNGLVDGRHHEDALSVQEAELSMRQRLGDVARNILAVQGNLAGTYEKVGRLEEALSLWRDVYYGHLEAFGEEHFSTITVASNYAITLGNLQRYAETKAVLRKMMLVARRALGENNLLTLKMRRNYATALYADPDATLDELREAVETLESATLSFKRIFGPAHPETAQVQGALKNARKALAARAAASSSGAA